ncbi:IS110 family transposase, partial [Mycobacterium marinum]|uniref:IS110 family transposase n=2 Tax=Mycobacterium marinum TaxID=1781 RepID=UPI0021C389AC
TQRHGTVKHTPKPKIAITQQFSWPSTTEPHQREKSRLSAAKIVAEVADIRRFRSEAAFANYIGLAPIPHSSGETNVRIRKGRHGNRQLNMAVHRIAVTQIHHEGPGKDYFQRRLAEGNDRHHALRSLKRRLARVVFNRLRADQSRVRADTQDHSIQGEHRQPTGQ